MRKKIIDFSSAYAQLILLVFLPTVILAAVGAYLVEKESSKAIKSEQRTVATAALIRYEPMVKQILPAMIDSQQALAESQNQDQTGTSGQDQNQSQNQAEQPDMPSLDDVQSRISTILTSMNNDLHIHRVAIIDEKGKKLASSGDQTAAPWIHLTAKTEQEDFISGIATPAGTAYGHLLGEYDGLKYWLFVDMDNEPLTIAQLKVWLGLGVTGLFTLLMLLLSLNIYAKRWIVPIYDLRLHLQQISPENMYLPVNTESSGELNQLQQDLVKTLRRLYGDFQELKDHSDQTEEDLRDAFDEMEMQNIFIREARDQAISSSQAKSAFLANISHELRTPLNSIDGFINLLARHGELTAEQDLYVQTIRKSSAHLLALVNDVLDFSKIEAGKLILDKHEFSLYSAIYDVMDMLSPLAAEKGLRMAVMYYNDVPNTIIGDALRIKQVLTNLVGNAIKFTDVGEVVVRVGVDEVADESAIAVQQADNQADNETSDTANNATSQPNDGMIHIAIQDTGHGLSDKAKTQLFKSFSQGDPSITRQYGGTGLGLVISKQLTRLMGGKIGFYNNDNNANNEPLALPDPTLQGATVSKPIVRTGATFWFSIPAHVEVDAPTDIEFGSTFEDIDNEAQFQLPILRPFAQAQGGDDKPFDMLVWINHAPTIQVFMAALRPLNINVTVARSLAGALERLKEEGKRWDWVVIDGSEGEGSEDRAALLKQIRLHYQGKLAIYGYQVALDATLLERYKAGGLYQPLDKRQLYRMLDTRTVNMSTMVAPPTWKGVTVLAVDDHLPNLLVLDALLSELGIKVITANSGYDAVDIISQQLMSETKQLTDLEYDGHNLYESDDSQDKPVTDGSAHNIDLVFMDVQMPRMSGDEAAKKIRQLEADAQQNHRADIKKLPIIALTAHGLADGKERLINAGIDDYVGKPISRPQLLQILQRWLGRGNETPVNSLRKEAQQQSLIGSDQLTDISQDESSDNEMLVVDWRDALVRSANKPELAKQLLLMMQQSVPEELEALEAAWEMRDREELGQIAHRVLGASRYSGVPQIRQASQDLEDKCLLNVQHTTPSQFSMLQPHYEALVDSLEQLQSLDLEAYITQQIEDTENKSLSENDMIWKMI
ncbi:histidine kinase dimerization/phospho-acceptor domain-containing protein [Psychrobacter sp. FDAARGOS_221]|uniref:histidine kinase dimerization/phospho-acceptor domain-containing protein n=1 Tax=Psychrobacter sp. FDAARGOS_221 TaxID=1975705 RepID=UPI000BB58676|nr:histidine kinase dimerization/phospho-acceptor domain-containing protein [Psychrobacter sp. FDAARGOS_221]PNK60369.1 hybrid sensor histidine kinase/response regulator [Psychrobacter sp. FDAARGOS_221]